MRLLFCQWLFLVPIKGGRWHIIPQLAVYIAYIPLIYCLLWGLYNLYHLLPEPEKSIDFEDAPSFIIIKGLDGTCDLIDLWLFCVYLGLSPLPVRVTTRIIIFLVGNPYKPSFPLLLGGGTTQCISEEVLRHVQWRVWWTRVFRVFQMLEIITSQRDRVCHLSCWFLLGNYTSTFSIDPFST